MSLAEERVRVYEAQPLRQVAGQTIRPGGMVLTDRALRMCALPPGAWVLDVGCGTGTTAAHAVASYRARAVGVDLSPSLLQEATALHASLPVLQATGERLPLPGSSVDALLAECVLSLMADLDRALAEWHRVLRPGGALAVTDLYARQPEGAEALHRLPLSSCLSGALPRDEILACLNANRFEVVTWEDHTGALKRFAAELILAHGSLDCFWCRTVRGEDKSEQEQRAVVDQIPQAVAAARPGYFLLIARALPRGGRTG
ncbi:MAG: class I SAM-dependent methyltransferase [Anaerolineae bacterium]|nr:class I SAM-dependent methyltransferase [Anaerolineae bacterium]